MCIWYWDGEFGIGMVNLVLGWYIWFLDVVFWCLILMLWLLLGVQAVLLSNTRSYKLWSNTRRSFFSSVGLKKRMCLSSPLPGALRVSRLLPWMLTKCSLAPSLLSYRPMLWVLSSGKQLFQILFWIISRFTYVRNCRRFRYTPKPFYLL